MKKSLLLFIAYLLLCCPVIAATDKELADAAYKNAIKEFNKMNYSGAWVYISDARALYLKINDTKSIDKCDELKGFLPEPAESGHIRAYQIAVKLYDSGDYLNARKLLIECLDVCRANESVNCSKEEALLFSLDTKLSKMQNNSRLKLNESLKLYEEAVRNGSLEGFQYAYASAAESKKLCAQIQNEFCYNQSVDLIQKINDEIMSREDGYKQEADEAYNEGRNQYLLGRGELDESMERSFFINATAEFQEAREIYQGLLKQTEEVGGDPQKEATYKGLIDGCMEKIAEVKEEMQVCCSLKESESLFVAAYQLYQKVECRNARLKADEALALFERVEDHTGAFKTKTLLYQIDDCLNKTNEAEFLLKETALYYSVADYKNTSIKLEKAARIYEKINNQEGIRRCAVFKQKISESVLAKKNADDLLEKARWDYGERRLEDARIGAYSAKKIYTELNYAPGINGSETILDDVIKLERTCYGCSPPSCFPGYEYIILLVIYLCLPVISFLLSYSFAGRVISIKSRVRRVIVSSIASIIISVVFLMIILFFFGFVSKELYNGSCAIIPYLYPFVVVVVVWLAELFLLAIANILFSRLKKK